MPRPKKSRDARADRIISFRVGEEVYDRLEKYGRGQRDDAGNPLNPSAAARKLVWQALQRVIPAKKSEKSLGG